jgi:hypothetical protein
MGYLKPMCGLFTATNYKCTIKKIAELKNKGPNGSDEMNHVSNTDVQLLL